MPIQTFKITHAPECEGLTEESLENIISNIRTDSEWVVKEVKDRRQNPEPRELPDEVQD